MDCLYPSNARMTAYSKGCRCRACAHAMRVYHRNYRRNNPHIVRAIMLRCEARKARA